MPTTLDHPQESNWNIPTLPDKADEPVDHTRGIGDMPQRTPSAFENLPEEILAIILRFLVQDPAKLLPFQERASLSFESFASTLPHVPEDANNILNFRLLCKKFANRGRRLVYARVKIRFTKLGFDRILSLTVQPEVAAEIQKLSYMVHDLYPQDQDTWQMLLGDARTSTMACQRRVDEIHETHNTRRAQSTPSLRRLEGELKRCRRNEELINQAMNRAREQAQILLRDEDEKALTAALSAFQNLEQIRLMRNTDKLDRDWEAFLNGASLNGGLAHSILRRQSLNSRWTTACERAARVLGRAYSKSNSMANRLSSRFMDPRAAWLQEHISVSEISSLSTCLKCLELQIDDPVNLEEKMTQLSNVFQKLFHAAENMEGLHIGLCRPISISLETIFHHVNWTNLQYIGFSRWNLNSNEIIGFIDRHRRSLTSVRFREIRLKDGSWLDIIKFLRQNTKLIWASFRQVGYCPSRGGGLVPETAPLGGFATLRGFPPEGPEEYSSEGSDDIGGHVARHGVGHAPELDESSSSEDDAHSNVDTNIDETFGALDLGSTNMPPAQDDGLAATSSDNGVNEVVEDDYDDHLEGSDTDSVAGDSEVGVVNALAIDDQTMVEHTSALVRAGSTCRCENGLAWADLEDDWGLDPTKLQWKSWERWVIKPCSEHDPKTF